MHSKGCVPSAADATIPRCALASPPAATVNALAANNVMQQQMEPLPQPGKDFVDTLRAVFV